MMNRILLGVLILCVGFSVYGVEDFTNEKGEVNQVAVAQSKVPVGVKTSRDSLLSTVLVRFDLHGETEIMHRRYLGSHLTYKGKRYPRGCIKVTYNNSWGTRVECGGNKMLYPTTPYQEPAYWYVALKVNAEVGKVRKKLRRENPALYLFSVGLRGHTRIYWKREYRYEPDWAVAGAKSGVRRDLTKAILLSAGRNIEGDFDWWDIVDAAKSGDKKAKRIVNKYKKVPGYGRAGTATKETDQKIMKEWGVESDYTKYDYMSVSEKEVYLRGVFNDLKKKSFDEQLVAAWASFVLVQHYRRDKRTQDLAKVVNRTIEVPLRKLDKRLHIRGPHYGL